MTGPMTPAEHYAYGQSLLKGCEALMEVDHPAAASQAIVAQAHFAAAAHGTAIRAVELLAYPSQLITVPDPAPATPAGGDD